MSLSKARRAIVVAPHPDDEILGCGGTIIKLLSSGWEVYVAFLTSGEVDQKIREKEAKDVRSFLKITNVFFLRLNKTTSLSVSLYGIKQLVKVFNKINPDVVFINHDNDADREHRISFEITNEAFWRFNNQDKNKTRSFILYEIHKPLSAYNLSEDISSVIDLKMKAMEIYRSQIKGSRIDLAIQGLNRYRGIMHENTQYAEVFQIKRLSSLLP